MVSDLYDLIGVARDADEQTINDAFRQRAREEHPDVSDHPQATDRFQRLLDARDVLTDATERDRYDRLGHETYVRRYLDWELSPASPSESESTTSQASTGVTETTPDFDTTTRQQPSEPTKEQPDDTDSDVESSVFETSHYRVRSNPSGGLWTNNHPRFSFEWARRLFIVLLLILVDPIVLIITRGGHTAGEFFIEDRYDSRVGWFLILAVLTLYAIVGVVLISI